VGEGCLTPRGGDRGVWGAKAVYQAAGSFGTGTVAALGTHFVSWVSLHGYPSIPNPRTALLPPIPRPRPPSRPPGHPADLPQSAPRAPIHSPCIPGPGHPFPSLGPPWALVPPCGWTPCASSSHQGGPHAWPGVPQMTAAPRVHRGVPTPGWVSPWKAACPTPGPMSPRLVCDRSPRGRPHVPSPPAPLGWGSPSSATCPHACSLCPCGWPGARRRTHSPGPLGGPWTPIHMPSTVSPGPQSPCPAPCPPVLCPHAQLCVPWTPVPMPSPVSPLSQVSPVPMPSPVSPSPVSPCPAPCPLDPCPHAQPLSPPCVPQLPCTCPSWCHSEEAARWAWQCSLPASVGHQDGVDPVEELGDAGVDAGHAGVAGAAAPGDDARQDPGVVLLAQQRAPRVTPRGARGTHHAGGGTVGAHHHVGNAVPPVLPALGIGEQGQGHLLQHRGSKRLRARGAAPAPARQLGTGVGLGWEGGRVGDEDGDGNGMGVGIGGGY